MQKESDVVNHFSTIDIRSMKTIVEWKAQPSCMAQFSFDENSIYSVGDKGEVNTCVYLNMIIY